MHLHIFFADGQKSVHAPILLILAGLFLRGPGVYFLYQYRNYTLPFPSVFNVAKLVPRSHAHARILAHYGGFWPHECVVNWWLSLAVIIAICSTGIERKKERKRQIERKREMLYVRSLGCYWSAVAAHRCAIYVDYGHSNVIPHRLFRRLRNA